MARPPSDLVFTGGFDDPRQDSTSERKVQSNASDPTPDLILDNSPELYGWSKEHLVLSPGDRKPFQNIRHLGHGSLGLVEEVRREGTERPSLVRKRVQLSRHKRLAEATMRIIREEAANLRRLTHANIVSFIGSYEDRMHPGHAASYCLLMGPVGDNDLKNFLLLAGDEDLPQRTAWKYQDWLSSWYTCLASALAFMHREGVRHQDIKPSNIIHKGEKIYFTDFSSAATFAIGDTTSTDSPARLTAAYAAPETIQSPSGSLPRYGRAADVFSLGCVFIEMLSVELGWQIWYFHDQIRQGGVATAWGDSVPTSESEGTPQGPPCYRLEQRALLEWIMYAEYRLIQICILGMLQLDRADRATADQILTICLEGSYNESIEEAVMPSTAWADEIYDLSQLQDRYYGPDGEIERMPRKLVEEYLKKET